jgi:hypothetical protein
MKVTEKEKALQFGLQKLKVTILRSSDQKSMLYMHSINRFDRLMQCFAASLIFLTVQNHCNSGLKCFAAHGIAAAAAVDPNCKLMLIILCSIDGGAFLLID